MSSYLEALGKNLLPSSHIMVLPEFNSLKLKDLSPQFFGGCHLWLSLESKYHPYFSSWPIYFQANNRELSSHVSNLSSVTEQKKLSPSKNLEWLDSVQFSCSVMFDSLWPHEPQHTRPPCPSPIPGVHSDSRPSSQWCHLAISSSVVPFSSCPQSFPASGSFQMSQLFTSGGQSIGVSASTSVRPMNIQDWSPLGWTGWISFQSKGLSRVFSSTTVWKHQFFSAQPVLWFKSHMLTWLLETP